MIDSLDEVVVAHQTLPALPGQARNSCLPPSHVAQNLSQLAACITQTGRRDNLKPLACETGNFGIPPARATNAGLLVPRPRRAHAFASHRLR